MVNLTSLRIRRHRAPGKGLRSLGPLETLIGLGLLTAGISWILILYRVLADSRTLSDEIALLLEADAAEAVTRDRCRRRRRGCWPT